MDQATSTAAADLVDALLPLDAATRPLFGGYCIYLDGKPVGLVNDGAVFLKRSDADHLFEDWATLAPAYPGGRPTWRLPATALADEPERVRDAVQQVGAALPAPRPKKSAR